MQNSTPKIIADRYEVLGELGHGGVAVVYEARDRRLNRHVAVKVLRHRGIDASAGRRFAREARVAAAVHHPNVCAVTDAGHLVDGRPFLVMERLWGETVRSLLRRVGRLDAAVAVDLALQLLSALECVHALGFVHRDVKPDNVIVVMRHGCPLVIKLIDFGMCRRAALLEEPRRDDTLTRAGTVVGTPEYMAPEQASGTRTFDARIDVYAAGLMLYEALTGTRAFEGDDVRHVLIAVLSKALPRLRTVRPELPAALDCVVGRALERDPGARYSTAAEFLKALHVTRPLLERGSSSEVQTEPDWEAPTRRFVRMQVAS
jgi:serine/threonine-protein kinase